MILKPLNEATLHKGRSLQLAVVVALSIALHGNATADTGDVKMLDTRIDDAKRAVRTAEKAANTICENAGYEIGQRSQGLVNNTSKQFEQCISAMQGTNDAIGLVGYLYEQRSHLTGEPLLGEHACNGKPDLGAPHPDANGHYTVCPNDPDDHSYKFWMITQVRLQVGSAKDTWSDGGFISLHRFDSEAECRMGIAKYEDYPSKLPYTLKDNVVVGDVCVEIIIQDVRELLNQGR